MSYLSRYVTLMPRDVIYTGTPGTTKRIVAGDVVEVELEGVGILRDRVTQPGKRQPLVHASIPRARSRGNPVGMGRT